MCSDFSLNRTGTKDAMSRDYSSVCNIGSQITDRMGVDEENNLLVVMGDVERYILTRGSFGVKIK